MAETVAVDTVESASPAPPQEAATEKVEVVNGESKLENGADHVENNLEAPNAASTPIKSKAKRRAIIANMRAAFARLGLISQLRTIGRRMRRTPKQQQQQQQEQQQQSQQPTEQTSEPQQQQQENDAAKNGMLDGATLLPTATAVNGDEHDEKCNNHVNGETHEEGIENAVIENGEAHQTSTITNETAEQAVAVAQ